MNERRGRFVTLEGGDGTGKSTQQAALAALASAAGWDTVSCREPGGTALGERLRAALFASATPPAPQAELLVFAAARAQLVHEVIRPALKRGALVLCDRFADSSVAYQQYGRGLPAGLVGMANAAATGGLRPDLTVLLDTEPAAALARSQQGANYMEREQLAFHHRVREGYRELARAEPERWLVVDATLPVVAVTAAIWERLRLLLAPPTRA
ncbi:MAG: dTMP kinase [Dehalococcoidia bacterium]|nr:dTMP kinase [Dehalococcoidia bacterium]